MLKSKYPYYHFICIGIVAISLIFPYVQYDLASGGFWNTGSGTIQKGLKESGLENGECFIPLLFLALSTFIALIKRHLATAIISLIIALGGLLYMPIMAFILTFSLFGPRYNETVQFGFVLAASTMLAYLIFSIANLVLVNRERKQGYKSSMENPDILDDADLLDTL